MIPTSTELAEFRAKQRQRQRARNAEHNVSEPSLDRWLLEQLGRHLAGVWRRVTGRRSS